uniref:Protein FAM122A-like n=1 Tax=Saccoglossus kowalevskii TaxID=10224 RepID=A0ABM0MA41_SACKO|nr:PREDICTED: protein FAM122A-like [Saccoglossus kowalevskii]
MQMPIRGNSLTPSPTPSPTRRTFTSRRSMSPITIRPSVLATTLKRKLGEGDVEMSPSKRYATVDNIPFSSHPHSSSDSSIEDPSPLTLTVPSGAVSTITTSTSTTTTNSTSCFNIFKPVTSQNS